MKFVSRYSHYLLVLKPGLPAQPMAGTPAVPGVNVLFEDGFATVNDEEIIRLIKGNKAFGTDIVEADPVKISEDPYVRSTVNPEHDMVEINFGHVGRNLNTNKQKLPPEMMKLVKKLAIEMASEAAPEMAMEMLKTMAAQNAAKQEQKDSLDNDDTVEGPATEQTAQQKRAATVAAKKAAKSATEETSSPA